MLVFLSLLTGCRAQELFVEQMNEIIILILVYVVYVKNCKKSLLFCTDESDLEPNIRPSGFSGADWWAVGETLRECLISVGSQDWELGQK